MEPEEYGRVAGQYRRHNAFLPHQKLSILPFQPGQGLGLGRVCALPKGVCPYDGVEPVSYTHLDVYKRQYPYRSGSWRHSFDSPPAEQAPMNQR